MKNEKALSLQNVTILFDTAWDTYKKYFYTLIKVNLIPVIVGMLAVSALSLVGDFEEISVYISKADFVSIIGLVFGASIVTVFVSSLNYIAQVVILEEGSNTSIYKTYNKASQILFPYFWIMILMGLIILLGMVLLIVPGIVFSVWFVFSAFILILENEKGVSALKKSKKYVKGIWFEVFLRFVALAFLGLLLNITLGILKGFVADISPSNQDFFNNLFDFLYTLVVTPYFVVYGYELYKDIVKANEGVSDPSADDAVGFETATGFETTSV